MTQVDFLETLRCLVIVGVLLVLWILYRNFG